jgi:ubiquinone biosynthesis protein
MQNDLERLIGESALVAVLPEAYAHYRRPVQGALGLFIESLEPSMRASVMQQQAMLPRSAGAGQRLALLARSCPALHKLGQSLARDRRLAVDFRNWLQQLESFAPTVAIEVLRNELVRELGPLERLGVTLLPPALAEASVAVVVPFQWAQDVGDRQGVFKVLKPGIADRLAFELELLEKVGTYLDERCGEFGIPRIDYRETFDQISEKLHNEVRFDLEQQHLAMAADFYAGDSAVRIPARYPFCTPHITAMERIRGRKVTDHTLRGFSKLQLAERVIHALIARPVLSRMPEAFFHADPHAGNLFLADDGRLAILDWSLVGRLGERQRAVMVQILLAALTLDAKAVVRILLDLNISRRCSRPALESAVGTWLDRIRHFQMPGFTWLMGMLDDAVQRAGLGLEADLVLFRKTLHALEGVLTDIGAPPSTADVVLVRDFIIQLVREWPLRWINPFFSRSFATRLSSADLLGLALTSPQVAARYWAPGG